MKNILGYTNYSVTPDGRVFSHNLRKVEMKPSADKNGYHRISLIGDDGSRKGMYVHQLVAQTYISNPKAKPFVNHKDHDKSNNAVDNLEWVTQQENVAYDWKMGKRAGLSGVTNPNHVVNQDIVDDIRDLHNNGTKQTVLASEFGISQATVSQIVRGITWRTT